MNKKCPRCCLNIPEGACVGESGIYLSHDITDLCEKCFHAEDREIDEAGTNNLPETLKRYRANMRRWLALPCDRS